MARPDPSDPWQHDPAAGMRRGLDLLSLIPLVAIIALVAMVLAVVWAVGRNDAEQARVKLATDALWVEQTLRFQMSVDEDMLARMALEAASGTDRAALDARARLHIATNPEILSLVWYDSDGRRVRALPGTGAPGDADLVAMLAKSGARVARPAYGDVQSDGTVSFGLALPGGAGFVTATVSLPLLLERHIPWWIAEQYGVRIFDANGREYADRQRMEVDPEHPRHAISFDPPLRGVFLEIQAYGAPKGFRSTLLIGAIAALAAFAILALLVLFRSAERRRAAETRLRAETAFRRSMEESLTVGLRAKDHRGRILYVNAAFCNLVGWDAADLVGRDAPMPYWDPDRLPETQARHRQLESSGAISQSFETRFRHRDGREIDVQVYEAPLIDARGQHRGWMGSVIDITDQKSAARLARIQDDTLARTARLVTLGEMATTLAHELNQPLSAIASYAAGMANLMESGTADPAILRDANAKLARQADRAGRIIRHIQDLVKKREPRFQPTQLSDVIAETVGFLSADAREHGVRIETDLSDTPPVAADRVLLEQVLINLIRNGIEAMAERRSGNRLRVSLHRHEEQAAIEIADQGTGIAEDMTGRLFEAFATTKPQGMGMGLKICRSIIELHHGQMSHRHAEWGGTVFRILLPLMDAGRQKGSAQKEGRAA
jgi:two-component system sensor histidine kinase DctS